MLWEWFLSPSPLLPGTYMRVSTKHAHTGLFLKTFYFILEHSWWTMLWQFQVSSKGTQLCIHMHPFSPKLPSHGGCHIMLSRVPCTILYSRSLLAIHPKYSSVWMSISSSLTACSPHPPPITISSFHKGPFLTYDSRPRRSLSSRRTQRKPAPLSLILQSNRLVVTLPWSQTTVGASPAPTDHTKVGEGATENKGASPSTRERVTTGARLGMGDFQLLPRPYLWILSGLEPLAWHEARGDSAHLRTLRVLEWPPVTTGEGYCPSPPWEAARSVTWPAIQTHFQQAPCEWGTLIWL